MQILIAKLKKIIDDKDVKTPKILKTKIEKIITK
jgi:hypothetical protein